MAASIKSVEKGDVDDSGLRKCRVGSRCRGMPLRGADWCYIAYLVCQLWLSKAHGVCLLDRSDEPASKHFLHILVCIKVLKSNQQINIQSSESRFSQLQHKHLTK